MESQNLKTRVAVDVGGTFTDLISFHTNSSGESKVLQCKVDTENNIEDGIINAVNKVALTFKEIDVLIHGTTCVINALTERKVVKTGLITSEGFRDVLEIARGSRPDFFNLFYKKPEPWVERYLRKEVKGIMSQRGCEIAPLDLGSLPQIINYYRSEGVEAIAVCMIGSYANPSHEQQIQEEIFKFWPEIQVLISSDITRQYREYERTSTTVMSASVKPIVQKYLSNLESKIKTQCFSGELSLMLSNCGVSSCAQTIQNPISLVESGPCSGIQGAASLGKLIQEEQLIALDIGGTTAKCSLIQNGEVSITTDYYIEKTAKSDGYPILTPVVDIVEIGNGGGSIAWVDSVGKLQVGPKSAGAHPGPVSYGQGGTEPTTTDANVFLGRLNKKDFCGGKIVAEQDLNLAFKMLSEKINLNESEVARAIVGIANNNMVNAIRQISVNKGHDPRDYALMAFGGGGGMHAAFLAKELGIKKVIVPKMSSVFSAWGMLLTDARKDYFLSQFFALDQEDSVQQIQDGINLLKRKAELEKMQNQKDPKFKVFAQARYENQTHFIEVEIRNPETINQQSLESFKQDFHTQYQREFTYGLEQPILIVGIHLISIQEIDKISPTLIKVQQDSNPLKDEREVDFSEFGKAMTKIYDGSLLYSGFKASGPAIIEEHGATIIIPPGMEAKIDQYGNTHIEVSSNQTQVVLQQDKMLTFQIIQSALEAISDQMFDAFRRTAMSTIISEILDMATGLTDGEGKMLSAGMGIPAFVGTLDKAVKTLRKNMKEKNIPIEEGDMFLLNDPYNGGVTHLNDHLLLLPIFHKGQCVAWACNIAHWGDIGGHIPGSMDMDAKDLFHEGIIIPGVKLYEKGILNQSVFETSKANSRTPDFLEGDLWAGVASVRLGSQKILELIEKYGLETFQGAIADYFDYGDKISQEGLKKLVPKVYEGKEHIPELGLDFHVKITVDHEQIVVDLRDNPDQISRPFNLSEEGAQIITQMIFKNITSPEAKFSNDGIFKRLVTLTKKGTMFNPYHPAPQSYYYETLILLHDFIWRTIATQDPLLMPSGHYSSICGTVIGGQHPDTKKSYLIVEAELGGWGASSKQDGISATYTAIHGFTYNCPGEVNEARNGLETLKYTFNEDQGGEGKYQGGQGVVIWYRIRAENAFIIAVYSKSKVSPWGSQGGRDGTQNYIRILRKNGEIEKYSQCNVQLEKGDIIEIRTGKGGGWGDPKQRDRKSIERDLKNEIITLEQAKEIYGFSG